MHLAGRPLGRRKMKVGSMCTGSVADAVALNYLAAALAAEDVHLDFEHSFSCENNPGKQSWIRKVHDAMYGGTHSCVFDDAVTLATENRFCVAHIGKCALPARLDMLIAGFSCKDFSRCNMNRASFHGSDVFNAQRSPGASSDTMHAVLRAVDTMLVDILVLENVDDLADELHRSGLDEFVAALSDRSYDIQNVVLNASDYALPQERKRLFIVAVARPSRNFSVNNYSNMFDLFGQIVKACAMCGGASFLDVLLADDSDAVVQDLERRINKQSKGWDSESINRHRAEWQKIGLRWQATRPLEADRNSAWFKPLAAREKDLLAFHQHCYLHKSVELQLRLVATDLNQSITQRSWASLGSEGGEAGARRILAPCVLPKSKLWVSVDPPKSLQPHHRFLLGYESMLLQGWLVSDSRFKVFVAAAENAFLQDLAGNAFPTTCVQAVVAALLFALRLDDAREEECALVTSENDVAKAMKMLKRDAGDGVVA